MQQLAGRDALGSFAQGLTDEKTLSCVQFLRRPVDFYAGLWVRIERVISDNGHENQFDTACDELIRHIEARAYMPKTNGKAPNTSSR